ncbi:LOW QUALITY PROTEIN: hypothetical protein PHMEG_00020865 [Phytophthora megakarya]|uniref:Uncharacterized protein n=1 Tax=Phytophthora megakarya TaxID=4795 RepID=A0A225VQL2_9STRA|nr:LOW QUALITY PROTEIN: hypothetical protein PHMEG_00020865 [Phytophthora megakarya]
MKAGFAVYNAELTKLRQYLEEHDRGKVCSPWPRMKALLAENASLRRANSHELNTDALILSTAGLSASGLDWELLGLGPNHTGLLRLMPPSSQSEGSVGKDSEPPVAEVSELPSNASLGPGSLNEESVEHSFIRPSGDSSVEPSTKVSTMGGLFDDERNENPLRKRKRLRQNAVATSSPSKLPAARRLGQPSVDLKRKAASTSVLSVARSGHKKARPSTPTPAGESSLSKESRSSPRPILEEGEIADDAGFDLGTEAPIGSASARSSPLSSVQVTATSGKSQAAATGDVSSKSVVEVLYLTADDATDFSSKKDSSPFSSSVVSYFPRQDGHPRRSTSVISELRMRENLERRLADDDFMLALTNEGSVATTSSPPQGTVQAVVIPAGVAELSTEESVATEPSTANSSVEAQVPHESSSAETPGDAEVSVRSSSRTRRGRGHVVQNDPRPRRPTRVITATVTVRRGTDTSTFIPTVAAISRATNSRKLPANAERFLKPGFTAVGAQKAWCKMLNVRLSAPAPKEHSPPLDFAFLALMHNVRSSRHPWRVLFDRMPSEPLTFSLGKCVKGVRISIRASGLGGLVRMWRRLSGHWYEDNKKVDLCVALWERRHWLQVSSMDNAIQVFRKASDPCDPFTQVILSLWADVNRTRNNRADLLR